MIAELLPLVDETAKAFAHRNPAISMLLGKLVGDGYRKVTELVTGAPTSPLVRDFRSFVLEALDRTYAQACGPKTSAAKQPAATGSGPGSHAPIEPPGATELSQPQGAYPLTDILRCCDGEFEEDVIAMKVAGRSDRQIAERFKVSDDTVLRTCRRIERRYEESNLAIGA